MFFSDSANLQKFTNQFIGILAAVAIPAFDGFRKKARSSEAKTNLGALYTAEKAYFYEGDKYSEVLATIGFEEPTGTRHYAVGFKATCATGSSAECYPSTAGSTTTKITAIAGKTGTTCELNSAGDEFIACAEGETASTNSNWQINHDKSLSPL